MKKKVITCMALLLSLGLLTGCFSTTTTDDDGDAEDYDYIFGFFKGSTLCALDGEVKSNGLSYTTDMAYAYVPREHSEDLEHNFTLSFYDHEDSETLEPVVKYLSVTTDENGISTLSYSDSETLIYTHDIEDSEIQYFGDESGEYFIGYDEETDCVTLLEVESYIESAPVCGMYNLDTGKFDRGGVGGTLPSNEEPDTEDPSAIPSEDEESDEDSEDSE